MNSLNLSTLFIQFVKKMDGKRKAIKLWLTVCSARFKCLVNARLCLQYYYPETDLSSMHEKNKINSWQMSLECAEGLKDTSW